MVKDNLINMLNSPNKDDVLFALGILETSNIESLKIYELKKLSPPECGLVWIDEVVIKTKGWLGCSKIDFKISHFINGIEIDEVLYPNIDKYLKSL